jgi:uncharacterized protein (DUF885 family)
LAATAASLLLPPAAHAAAPFPAPGGADAKAQFDRDLAAFADEIVRLSPENATSLGIDKGAYAHLKGRLADISVASDATWASEVASIRKRLVAFDPAQLSPTDQVRHGAVLFAADRGIEGTAFRYGASAAGGLFGGASPYAISQQGGALTQVPEFLNSQHQIADGNDAEAYLARVMAFARQIDQENERIRQDSGIGVAPPGFIADKTLRQIKGFRSVAAARQPLVSSLADRAAKAGINGDWATRCSQIVEHEVYPALDRQIAAFAAATAKTAPGAGVQRLPDGDAYYQWALRLGTTTTRTADEVHALGLEQNAEIKARMDTLLKRQGMSQRSVGERLQALNSDPRFLYPNDDAGRAALIGYLNTCVARVRPLLGELSHLGLRADLVIKRVPADIEAGAALGYMNFAALDGSRPAIYYVNLKSTSLWPKYQLQTLTAHEGVPGHTWQGAYLAEHHAELPLISSLLGFNAFVEGWALYAEQLVDEYGIYRDDPFGQLGYLQAQQFRACRLVADTGLHAKGWSRDKTIGFLVEETGRGVDAMTSETDRYCASPGQACGYKMGHNEILRLRENARAALGPRFQLADYNDMLVKTGGVPLTVLATAVDAWLASARAAGA